MLTSIAWVVEWSLFLSLSGKGEQVDETKN